MSATKLERGKNDLATLYPELAAEWHPTKNEELSPSDVTCGSSKKVWWQCPKGHEWQAVIYNRCKQKQGCPYCSGRKVLSGFNDLASRKPALATEWHPTKNGSLSPSDVTCGSQKQVWWKCKYGHEWKATVVNRFNDHDCPYCTGRKVWPGFNDLASQYPELAAEWHPTKNGELKPDKVTCGSDKKVWWQCSHGHEWQSRIQERCHGRNCPYCEGRKPRKAPNNYVRNNVPNLALQYPDLAAEWHPTKNGKLTPENVSYGSGQKVWWRCTHGHEWQAVIRDRVKGQGCPYCSGRRVIPGFNDFKTLNPEAAAEWHPTKNGNLSPDNVKSQSNRCVWWKCSLGHEWQATVGNRSQGSGCPYCAGRKVQPGFNDLASQNPNLAMEWHPTRNESLSPADVTCGSTNQVWWQCLKGHEWKASIASRNAGNGCPYCAGKQVIKGETDLETVYPDIAKQWHPTKNGRLKPVDVSCGSHKVVWWCCEHGHEWRAAVHQRIKQKCPICSNRRVLKGYNDLASQYPKIACEWAYDLNDFLPDEIVWGSARKVWWRCEQGHEWKAAIRKRTNYNQGCPQCAASHGERAISAILKRLDVPYLHDKPIEGCNDINPLRHDFILMDQEEHIIATIEFHGIQHYEPTAFHSETKEETEKHFQEGLRRDAIKTQWLQAHNIPQLIIPYTEIDNIEELVSQFVMKVQNDETHSSVL